MILMVPVPAGKPRVVLIIAIRFMPARASHRRTVEFCGRPLMSAHSI